MKKRLLTVLLCLIMVMALVPATAFADVGNLISYTTTDTDPVVVKLIVLTDPVGDTPGTVQVGNGIDLAIGGGEDSITVTSVTLPEVITVSGARYRVTKIGADAFHNITKLQSVTLPEVTTIGDNAFTNCTNLTNVNLPKVRTIGSNAFAGCSSLMSVTIWQTLLPFWRILMYLTTCR